VTSAQALKVRHIPPGDPKGFLVGDAAARGRRNRHRGEEVALAPPRRRGSSFVDHLHWNVVGQERVEDPVAPDRVPVSHSEKEEGFCKEVSERTVEPNDCLRALDHTLDQARPVASHHRKSRARAGIDPDEDPPPGSLMVRILDGGQKGGPVPRVGRDHTAMAHLVALLRGGDNHLDAGGNRFAGEEAEDRDMPVSQGEREFAVQLRISGDDGDRPACQRGGEGSPRLCRLCCPSPRVILTFFLRVRGVVNMPSCEYCQGEVPEGALFCPQCGRTQVVGRTYSPSPTGGSDTAQFSGMRPTASLGVGPRPPIPRADDRGAGIPCPHCHNLISRMALVCPACGQDLPSRPPGPPPDVPGDVGDSGPL
jgi:RNA polymerase subunit RPABC4/transcription elongation factor Spt4